MVQFTCAGVLRFLTLLTPAISANPLSLNIASSPSLYTTSICTVAVAELNPERSDRMPRRREEQSSSPLSTFMRVIWCHHA